MAAKAGVAGAGEAAIGVCAGGVVIAIVASQRTFVVIGAGGAISRIAAFSCAGERTGGVGAGAFGLELDADPLP